MVSVAEVNKAICHIVIWGISATIITLLFGRRNHVFVKQLELRIILIIALKLNTSMSKHMLIKALKWFF